jgi:hypothetical protein
MKKEIKRKAVEGEVIIFEMPFVRPTKTSLSDHNDRMKNLTYNNLYIALRKYVA